MANKLKKFFSYSCLGCGIGLDSSEQVLCPNCENIMKSYELSPTAAIVSAVSYYPEQTKTLLFYMKDYYEPCVFDYAASLIEEKLRNVGLCDRLTDFRVTYAPRNPKKLFKKRYDQSKEIADFLSLRLFGEDKGRVISMFKRSIFTSEQKKLNMVKRAQNARKQFKVRKHIAIPEKLMIVDDVATTGSTLFTLKELAFEAGVKECILCTVAFNDRKFE